MLFDEDLVNFKILNYIDNFDLCAWILLNHDIYYTSLENINRGALNFKLKTEFIKLTDIYNSNDINRIDNFQKYPPHYKLSCSDKLNIVDNPVIRNFKFLKLYIQHISSRSDVVITGVDHDNYRYFIPNDEHDTACIEMENISSLPYYNKYKKIQYNIDYIFKQKLSQLKNLKIHIFKFENLDQVKYMYGFLNELLSQIKHVNLKKLEIIQSYQYKSYLALTIPEMNIDTIILDRVQFNVSSKFTCKKLKLINTCYRKHIFHQVDDEIDPLFTVTDEIYLFKTIFDVSNFDEKVKIIKKN